MSKPYPYLLAYKETEWIAGQPYTKPISIEDIAPRGVAIEATNLNDWVAADVAIQRCRAKEVTEDTEWGYIRDSEGNKVVVRGLTESGDTYAFPPEAWFIGAYTHIRFVSVSTDDSENTVNQSAAVPVAAVFAV